VGAGEFAGSRRGTDERHHHEKHPGRHGPHGGGGHPVARRDAGTGRDPHPGPVRRHPHLHPRQPARLGDDLTPGLCDRDHGRPAGQLVGTPIKGIFTALRDFQCGGGTGFVVRLRASFANEGSSGTWSIVDAYGDLAGLSGSGKLVGEPVEGGIIDHYNGWVTVH
jgi:hypothetical protein